MREGLLAAGTALLLWALSLRIIWGIAVTRDDPEQMRGMGRRFVISGAVLLVVGLGTASAAPTTGPLAGGTVSFGLAVMLAGFAMVMRGLVMLDRGVESIKVGLGYGSWLAAGAGLICVAVALWDFASTT